MLNPRPTGCHGTLHTAGLWRHYLSPLLPVAVGVIINVDPIPESYCVTDETHMSLQGCEQTAVKLLRQALHFTALATSG